MGASIISVLLAIAGWVFTYVLPSNAEAKKKEAELIGKWIERMDKAFLTSPKIAKAAKEIWKKKRSEPWKETGVEEPEVVHPVQK